jgi:hypothetical protein
MSFLTASGSASFFGNIFRHIEIMAVKIAPRMNPMIKPANKAVVPILPSIARDS